MQPKEIEERYTRLKEEIEIDIQVSLASRAAEEIFLNTQMTGFSGDLSNATSQAIVYCGMVGMNGHLSSMNVLQLPASSMQIEVENFLQQQYKKVKQLLEANQDMCHALAEALLEHEELLGDEVTEIINRFPTNLTTDAKAKRMGFHVIKDSANAGTRSTGVDVEPAAAVAATGTYGGSYDEEDGVVFPGAAAYAPGPAAAKAPAAMLPAPTAPVTKAVEMSAATPLSTSAAASSIIISASDMTDPIQSQLKPEVTPPTPSKTRNDDEFLPPLWWE